MLELSVADSDNWLQDDSLLAGNNRSSFDICNVINIIQTLVCVLVLSPHLLCPDLVGHVGLAVVPGEGGGGVAEPGPGQGGVGSGGGPGPGQGGGADPRQGAPGTVPLPGVLTHEGALPTVGLGS